MQFKLTIWFAIFAGLIFILTLAGRIFKWRWLFTKAEHENYWESAHVFRYTLVPLGFAAFGFYLHFTR